MEKKSFINLLLFVLLIIALIGARVLFLQYEHFDRAESFFENKNLKLALREYDSALHMYTPFSPFIHDSASRLWSIGEAYEAEGDNYSAINAYSSIRSSMYASRSFFTPRRDWIRKCNAKLAALSVKILQNEGLLSTGEADLERERLLFVLTEDRSPGVLWSLLAELALFGWVGSVILTIFTGFDSTGMLRSRQMLLGILAFVITFGIWTLALLNA